MPSAPGVRNDRDLRLCRSSKSCATASPASPPGVVAVVVAVAPLPLGADAAPAPAPAPAPVPAPAPALPPRLPAVGGGALPVGTLPREALPPPDDASAAATAAAAAAGRPGLACCLCRGTSDSGVGGAGAGAGAAAVAGGDTPAASPPAWEGDDMATVVVSATQGPGKASTQPCVACSPACRWCTAPPTTTETARVWCVRCCVVVGGRVPGADLTPWLRRVHAGLGGHSGRHTAHAALLRQCNGA